MPIQIADNKTLEQCRVYEDSIRTIYADGNPVTVTADDGFYPYYLEQLQAREQVVLTPNDDQEYYEGIIRELEVEYSKTKNVRKFVQREVVILVGINFAVTVYKDGRLYIGPGKTEDGINLPPGKLAFVTGATSKTHSFIVKGIESSSGFSYFGTTTKRGNVGNGEYFKAKTNDRIKNCGYSNVYNFSSDNTLTELGYKGVNIDNVYNMVYYSATKFQGLDSFRQLLIYQNDERGGMTQAELDRELSKDVRLK